MENKDYKTSKQERTYQRQYYAQHKERYQLYKKEQMRRRRANPEINERIKAKTREWYQASGRANRQKLYLVTLRKERFFKWRARLFNMRYKTQYTEVDFKLLWDKQEGKCLFTRWELDDTAEIDHIIPIKRGGTHHLSNLRWLCREANWGKRGMLDSEYINVIEAIGLNLTRN